MAGFSHESPMEGATNVWLTPKHVIDVLGPFDTDPCAASVRPFDCARINYTVEDDGYVRAWEGLIWLNPPYGPHAAKWLDRLSQHQPGGIALIFARTDTKWLQRALVLSSGQLWYAGRLSFLRPNGDTGTSNSGAPSVFLAFGEEACQRLFASPLIGVRTRRVP